MDISKNGQEVIVQEKNKKVSIIPGKKMSVSEGKKRQHIDCPGEYEIAGIFVRGIAENASQTAFRVMIDGIRIFFPGDEAVEYSEEDKEDIGEPEIIYVRAESSKRNAKQWKKFLEDMDPRIICFGEEGEKTATLIKELNVAQTEDMEKASITAKNLPADKTRYIRLI